MSTSGDLSASTESRLRTHASAVVRAGAVPRAHRDDLTDELLGHLRERTLALRIQGLAESTAADRAIADFGTPEAVGPELVGVYHSRLWASTIGVLLPAVADRTHRPAVVGWIRLMLAISVVFSLVAVVLSTWIDTPGRTIAFLVLTGPGIALAALAIPALVRGQRWALWYGIGVSIEFVMFGIGQLVTASPGILTIPIGAIVGGGILLVAWAHRSELATFVSRSARFRPAVAIAFAATLVLTLIAPVILGNLATPPRRRHPTWR